MRTIDVSSWPRRSQFELFRDSHLPYFNVCADVDMTATRRAVQDQDVPTTAAIVYLVARTANQIREFRYRIRDDTVVEHDMVHPASTVMTAGDLFTFCFYEYHDDFRTFVDGYETATADAQAHPSLDDPENRDDLLFMTAIPWVSFTSFSHPVLSIPADSIPRFAWGRFYERGGSVMMPLSVQGHHALMDGFHVGKYFECYQDSLHNPDDYMTSTT
jgi:chloramphenicol O-acetyltransferase type A